MISVELRPRLSRDGKLTTTARGWRLEIAAGGVGSYRLAQMDDQAGRARRDYPWHPPLTLDLRARAGAASAAGTWGFGFWNDPYGFSFGPGERFPRLPTLPQAAWFFSASARNYLSFRDDRPGRGFLAQAFDSKGWRPSLLTAALALPFSPRTTRRLLSGVISGDSAEIAASPLEWHSYRLEWTSAGCNFLVDRETILRTTVSPRAPLGLVVWVDNQYAAFDPEGRIRWGTEPNSAEAWLDVEDLKLTSPADLPMGGVAQTAGQ